MERSIQPSKKLSKGAAIFCIIFGAYLLLGGFAPFVGGHWPVFMPPLLDAVAMPLSFISQQLGIVIGATISGMLGIACVAFGVHSLSARPQA